jgi:hypothetical protein
MADMNLSPLMPPAVTDIAEKGKQGGATPDMIQAELIEKSAKFPNLVPLASAFLVKSQLEQAQKAMPAPQPAPGNVMTDMLGQLSSMSAQRQKGIAALPNPTMNNANFARGGIIALAGGGDEGLSGYDDEDYRSRPNPEAGGAAPDVVKKATGIRGALGNAVKWGGKLITNPYVMAASIGAPILYHWLMGDDKDKKTEAANVLSQVQAGKKVDVSKYYDKAQTDGVPAAPGASRVDTSGLRGAYANLEGQYKHIADDPENKFNREQYTDRAKQRREKAGIGAANEEEMAYQQEQDEKLKQREKGSFWTELGKGLLTAGNKVAMEGGTTGQALFAGLGQGVTNYEEARDKLDAMRQALKAKEFDLKRNREALSASDLATGDAQYEKAQSEIRNANLQIAQSQITLAAQELNVSMDYIGRQEKMQLAQYTAALSKTKYEKESEKFIAAYMQAAKMGDTPAKERILEDFGALTRAASGAVQAAQIKAESAGTAYAALRDAATGQTASSGGKYEGFSARPVGG